ncbi:MAG TPA: hypothetical protein VHB25_18425 [Gemmatimonadaceae bacterium]|nr:hypothetical protein [Gemmatimonadaceae bacterium]
MSVLTTASTRNARPRTGRRTAEGLIVSYIHHNGKLGALVEVNCETDFVARTDEFRELARRLAEQVAATAPVAVDLDAIPFELLERKREAYEQETRLANKPEHLVPKIVAGKIDAFLRDVTLLEQPWVREPGMRVRELVDDVAAKTGENIQVRRFSRFHMGLA